MEKKIAKVVVPPLPEGMEPIDLPNLEVLPEIDQIIKKQIRDDLVSQYRQREIMMKLTFRVGNKELSEQHAEALKQLVAMVRELDKGDI